MPATPLTDEIYAVGVNQWNRMVFDALFPLPNGTSYNAYLVRGSEKTALIDTVEPSTTDRFMANLVSLHLERLDYVISNHAEQDHSGAIPDLLARFPQAKVVIAGNPTDDAYSAVDGLAPSIANQHKALSCPPEIAV